MILYFYLVGAITSFFLTPIWMYMYYRRLGLKVGIVEWIYVPILSLTSWIWIYCMWWIFDIEDNFEVKTLGMVVKK